MRNSSVWKATLGLQSVVVERVDAAQDAVTGGPLIEVRVRSYEREQSRCVVCGARCPGYDAGPPARRWRALVLGTVPVYLVAALPRVRCAVHGVRAARVPWARAHSRFTRQFEDQVAWLATHTAKGTVGALMRVAWRTVGQIVDRVVEDAKRGRDLLFGLTRIGIDEISFRKGQRYLTVVIDHDTGRLVWAAEGRDKQTLNRFFDQLGSARCAGIELVSCDMAAWICGPVQERCENAEVCLDAFHVVQLATDAPDQVRRQVWNEARKAGMGEQAKQLKNARFALWKNPERLTDRQAAKLSEIQATNRTLFRAYLLKEQLRQIWRAPTFEAAMELLDGWLSWACRCQIPAFVKLSKTIRGHRERIAAALFHGLSNARIEAANTTLRLIARRAFGFHSADAMIALGMLKLGGLCPPLPGR
ncbi:ISL3 family transposase [Patulibacter sp. NPDC049589]|uniref:ISL3 family transposase n=1 Tax=Patulibacter sp. NPDC049589 TaxID=3154731 RepID=UPI00342499CE